MLRLRAAAAAELLLLLLLLLSEARLWRAIGMADVERDDNVEKKKGERRERAR